MITCTWCGTNYAEFQPTCDKCGGSLPLPEESALDQVLEDALGATEKRPPIPSPPPRSVPGTVALRILGSDGGAIVGGTFSFMGAIFAVVGVGLTVGVVTAFVGIPFALIGLLFLAIGVPLFVLRFQSARQTVEVLRQGESVLGRIEDVSQNYNVRVNGRHPWTIHYSFEARGRGYEGKVTTLSKPDLSQHPGRPAYVLYMADEPEQNSIYPNPYGYYGV